jgi:ClpP class serine protease
VNSRRKAQLLNLVDSLNGEDDRMYVAEELAKVLEAEEAAHKRYQKQGQTKFQEQAEEVMGLLDEAIHMLDDAMDVGLVRPILLRAAGEEEVSKPEVKQELPREVHQSTRVNWNVPPTFSVDVSDPNFEEDQRRRNREWRRKNMKDHGYTKAEMDEIEASYE